MAQAERLRLHGHLASAEALLRDSLQARPADPQGLSQLGHLLLAEHRYREALPLFLNLQVAGRTRAERAAALVGAGRALAGNRQPGRAAEQFQAARSQADPSGESLARLALARQQTGQLADAARLWEEYLALRPDMPLARRHYQRDLHLAATIRRLRRALEANPKAGGVAIRLAQLLEEAGDPSGAAEVLARPEAIWPLGAEPRFLMARLLLEAGNHDAARSALLSHLKELPHHLAAFYALAAVEAAAGARLAEARAWQGALALRPGDRFAARSLYRALSLGGGLEEEIRRLEGLQTASASTNQLVSLSLARQAAGRPVEALLPLLQALETEPNDNSLLEPLRDHLEGRPKLLLRAFEELTRRAATRPAALRARGALRAALGDPAGGVEDLTAFLARFPDDIRGQVALASARRARGELDTARALLEGALVQAPAYPFALLDLAAIALHQGQPAVALENARNALKTIPMEPLAHTLAGAALLEQGEVRQALTELGRALAVAPIDAAGPVLPLALRAFLLAGDPESVRVFLRSGVPLEPEQLYLLAWRYLRDSYLGANYDPRRWLEWRDRFSGRLQDSVDAHAAIGRLAASLDDPHTRLLGRDHSLDRLLATGEVLAVDPETATAGARSLYWTLRGEGGVYLRLTSLRDPAAAQAVQEVLDSFPDTVEVVLDLRGNPGGYEDQAHKIAELLLPPQGEPAARWRTRTGGQELAAAGRSGPAAQVEVLVDGETASAAEHLAETLVSGGSASLVGGPMAGKRVAQIPYILPDGWTLLVTAARVEETEH